MKGFSNVFYRKIFCLFSHHGFFGMNQIEDALLNPCHRLLRNYSYCKSSLVSADDVVKYWQVPESECQQHICSPFGKAAKTDPAALCKTATTELVSLILDEECRKRLTSACSKDLQDFPETHGPVILEVGCGSGAIGLSLLKKLPHSRLIAIDKLEAAVNLTKENAERLHLQERIHTFHHDISSCSWECLLPWGLVDAIVSNPPYIFHEDMTDLAVEILCFEDPDALDGGNDGMSVIKEILSVASYILKDCGSVYLEVDPRHPEMVKNWLSSHPDLFFFVSTTYKDFCGKPRFLHIQKRREEDHQGS
ncbi:MTRF1L release factor glutamine methyltransferase isoform X1 [Candoia aspera]|uniref:MTRF1L release factor glutamine methyltransferase isoform X1 n=1 Tax=Candoia aspera TaxID=51853 RepID=UPI002FD7C1F0